MKYALDKDVLPQLQRANRRKAISTQTEMKAILGNGQGQIYVPEYNGNRVYVRLSGSVSDAGVFVYSQVAVARVIGGNYFEYEGCPITCKYDTEGNLIVSGLDYTRADQAGLSIPMLNPVSAQNTWLDLTKATIALSRPVATGETDSTRVAVAPLIIDTHGYYKTFYGTPTQADKIDLSAYIPSTTNHCIAQLWLNTYDLSIEVTTSTTQAITTALDNTDVDECFTQRYQDWLPLQSYLLKDAQATIRDTALWRDHRQFINTPHESGFRSPLIHNWHIWDDRQVTIYESLELSDYTLLIEDGGSLVVLGGDVAGSDLYSLTVTTVTTTYTVLSSDYVLLCDGTFTVTLPSAVGLSGKEYHIKNVGTGVITIDANGTETIDGQLTWTNNSQWSSNQFVSNGANWFII